MPYPMDCRGMSWCSASVVGDNGLPDLNVVVFERCEALACNFSSHIQGQQVGGGISIAGNAGDFDEASSPHTASPINCDRRVRPARVKRLCWTNRSSRHC
mmetsp:Transcript_127163/g.254107  ORF Transcript_127163/g.254107 Transcript_127163/m.254107 type:complete len:100 (-) Transcript_127163:20-319(-)